MSSFMLPDHEPDAGQAWLELARRSSLLSAAGEQEIRELASKENCPIPTAALRSGVLKPADLEILNVLTQPETIFPGYLVHELRGRGGMGVVYRATQKSLNRVVALKSVLLAEQATSAVWQRFEQEARAIGGMVHPQIVTAYDFGRVGQRLFLALEYVDGEDAESLVRRTGPLDEALAWQLILQAAGGLAHALERNVVHRDVKPANLLLMEPPQGFPLAPGIPLLKLTDFGLALLTVTDDLQTRLSGTQAVGSPQYMAPEQLDSAAAVDHRADIYSLGASAYHFLTGEAPFSNLPLTQIIANKLQGRLAAPLERRPELSLASQELLLRMMHLNRDDRPQSYGQLIHELQMVLRQVQTGAGLSSGSPEAYSGSIASAAIPTLHLARQSTDIELSAPPPAPVRLSRRGWRSVLSGGVLLMATVLAIVYFQTPPTYDYGTTDHVTAGETVHLFEGQSLKGWRVQSGEWSPFTDSEGAAVLAGANGVLTRALSDLLRPVPASAGSGTAVTLQPGLANPLALRARLVLTIQPTPAAAGQVRFALNPQTGEAWVVQIGPEGSQVAMQNIRLAGAVAPRLIEGDPPVPLPPTSTGYHEVRIERHSRAWWVWIDGSFTARLEPIPGETAQIQLVATGTSPTFPQVMFADLLTELLALPAPR